MVSHSPLAQFVPIVQWIQVPNWPHKLLRYALHDRGAGGLIVEGVSPDWADAIASLQAYMLHFQSLQVN
jgi:hypothetical protein